MSIVTVYRFKKYDIVSNETKVAQHLATRETVSGLGEGFVVIEGTGVEVESAHLDGNGMIAANSTPTGADVA